MTMKTHHSKQPSTHGKFFETLTPWRHKEKFDNKFFYDKRTQAVPKSMFQNELMEAIAKDQDGIEQNEALHKDIYRLKDNSFLNDNYKFNFKKHRGQGGVYYVYNDYNQKRAAGGFSTNPNGGMSWFH